MSRVIAAAVEGYPDEAVVRSLCRTVGLELGKVYVKRGKGELDKHLPGYNAAARFAPWLVLRDLNHDASCPPELRNRLLPNPAPQMRFQIVVRKVEAWILADTDQFARFLGVGKTHLPRDPEGLDDPKREVINLARKSKKRKIREDMVPRPGSGGQEGPAYASRLAEFALNSWRPEVAATKCESLRRCLDRMREWS